MTLLASDETDLQGSFVLRADRFMVADETEQRIHWLVTRQLVALSRDWSGWCSLYRDPGDGRLWELTYPRSEMHGGGPRRLRALSSEEAAAKYSHASI